MRELLIRTLMSRQLVCQNRYVDDVAAAVGLRLRARRSELGLTLAQVSQEAGLSLPYVANLEKGRGNPTLDVLVALSRALSLPTADLLGPAEVSELDERLADLPPVLVDFGRGHVLASVVERLAYATRVEEKALRSVLVRAMASLPRRHDGSFTVTDCQRFLDAVSLMVAD